MLVIRPEQLAALELGMLAGFEDRVLAHLHEIFPGQISARPSHDLRVMICDGTVRAKQHGITRERDVVLFIDLMVGLGPTFDEPENNLWASEILAEPDVPGTLKIERLYDELERRNGNQTADVEVSA